MKDPNTVISQEPETKENPASSKEEKNSSSGSRRFLMWLIAGAYLIYTAYELCRNVIEGAEGTGPGFFVAGIAFGIIGALMLAAGIKGYVKMDKEKKAAEERQKAENPAPVPAPPKKTSMSIAERARLAERLKEEETPEESEAAKESSGDNDIEE